VGGRLDDIVASPGFGPWVASFAAPLAAA